MFSILLPVYNNQASLILALDSILEQIQSDDELLVIDDASTDNSAYILSCYFSIHRPNISMRLITNPINIGLAASLNILIALASKPYICRMDADDVAFPNRLDIQREMVQQYPAVDIFGGAVIPFLSFSEFVNLQRYKDVSREPCLTIISSFSIAFRNKLAHPTTVIRRSIFSELLYNDFYEKAQDYKLWLDCAFRSYSFGIIQVPLLFYSAKSSSPTVKKQLMFALKARFSVLSISRPFFSLSLLLGMLYDLKNLLTIWFKPL